MVGPDVAAATRSLFSTAACPGPAHAHTRTCPCTQPSCKYMSACIGMCHAQTYIWCAPTHMHRDTPPRTCRHVYSIHVCTDLHTCTSHRAIQTHSSLPASQAPQVYTRVHRPGEDHQLRKHPQGPVSSLQTLHHWLALLTMAAWSSQPSGYASKQATTTQRVE